MKNMKILIEQMKGNDGIHIYMREYEWVIHIPKGELEVVKVE